MPLGNTTTDPATIAVMAEPGDTEPLLHHAAQRLATELSLPTSTPDHHHDLLLTVTPHRIELRPNTKHRSRPVYVDFAKLDTTSSAGRTRNQPLFKAVTGKNTKPAALYIVDATAGYGEDTWLLASLGCTVCAFERSPVISALLKDGLRRAEHIDPDTARRITLKAADARDTLPTTDPRPEVVYLDPMFPPKSKHALPSMALRLLRSIVGHDPDATDLLAVALRTATRRVVVKRPLHAPPLEGTPAHTYKGKSMRYDVYTSASTPPVQPPR